MSTRRKLKKTLNKGLLLFFLLMVLAGCPGGEGRATSQTLLTCGSRGVTVRDYHDALTLALQGYPYESLSSGDEVGAIRLGVFHQLQEELLLLCVADEKGLTLSGAELDQALADARAGYPEGAFDTELLNRGLSLGLWTRRLSKRLLVEKVLKAEFGKERPLSYADFQAVRDGMTPGLSEQGLIQQVKRTRMEAAYRSWRQGVDGKYSIEVNAELWEKILEEGRP